MSNTDWAAFCTDYAAFALEMAKLFIWIGLVTGLAMAAVEVYKLYREARAISSSVNARADAPPAAPGAGEIIKGLVGPLTGAKAWLALVILGIILFWLAGSSTPAFCTQPPGVPNRQL